MFKESLRSEERFRPPQGDGGLGVWGILTFFVVFPFSRVAFKALYGWATGPAGYLLTAMLSPALLMLQASAVPGAGRACRKGETRAGEGYLRAPFAR